MDIVAHNFLPHSMMLLVFVLLLSFSEAFHCLMSVDYVKRVLLLDARQMEVCISQIMCCSYIRFFALISYATFYDFILYIVLFVVIFVLHL